MMYEILHLRCAISYLAAVPQIMVIHEAPSTLEAIDLRRHSLTEQVYDAIRDAIVSKALPPGIRLSEAALAEKFGVSKTPVREALLRLGAVGLVESEGNATRVVTPSRDRIRHAYEVRGGHEFRSEQDPCAGGAAPARSGRVGGE